MYVCVRARACHTLHRINVSQAVAGSEDNTMPNKLIIPEPRS